MKTKQLEEAFKKAKAKAMTNLKLLQKRIEEIELNDWSNVGDLDHINSRLEQITVNNG